VGRYARDVIEFLTNCDSCRLNYWFGVTFEEPPTAEEVRAAIIQKLGPDATYICPRCQSLVFVHVNGGPIATPQRLQRAAQARRIGRSSRGIRFGVGRPDGARSSVWRVWMNNRRDDVYISARALASELKASLHRDYWYFGFPDQHVRRETSFVPLGSDRKKYVWDRPEEFGAGWTRAFEIIVPGTEIVEAPLPYTGSEAVWLPAPSPDEAANFTVLLSKPDAPRGRRGYPNAEGFEDSTEFITRLEMKTGERLWVLAHVEPMTNDRAEEIERARRTVVEHACDKLVAATREDAKFSARALVFADSPDGVPRIVDVSLAAFAASVPGG
jgi:hypothetical protein